MDNLIWSTIAAIRFPSQSLPEAGGLPTNCGLKSQPFRQAIKNAGLNVQWVSFAPVRRFRKLPMRSFPLAMGKPGKMFEHAHRYSFRGQGAYLLGHFPVVADPNLWDYRVDSDFDSPARLF